MSLTFCGPFAPLRQYWTRYPFTRFLSPLGFPHICRIQKGSISYRHPRQWSSRSLRLQRNHLPHSHWSILRLSTTCPPCFATIGYSILSTGLSPNCPDYYCLFWRMLFSQTSNCSQVASLISLRILSRWLHNCLTPLPWNSNLSATKSKSPPK